MNKKYSIKVPVSEYVQVISILAIPCILSINLSGHGYVAGLILISLFSISLLLIANLVRKVSRKTKQLELTENTMKVNQITVPIQTIEKIIIDGYSRQSIGIKLTGKRLVPTDLHFAFKDTDGNAGVSLGELKQWANMNKVKVSYGKIYRWI